MNTVVSSVFYLVQFPHQRNIITIDHLDIFTPDVNIDFSNNVPLLGNSLSQYESVGVGICKDSSLVGVFPLISLDAPLQVVVIKMISNIRKNLSM